MHQAFAIFGLLHFRDSVATHLRGGKKYGIIFCKPQCCSICCTLCISPNKWM